MEVCVCLNVAGESVKVVGDVLIRGLLLLLLLLIRRCRRGRSYLHLNRRGGGGGGGRIRFSRVRLQFVVPGVMIVLLFLVGPRVRRRRRRRRRRVLPQVLVQFRVVHQIGADGLHGRQIVHAPEVQAVIDGALACEHGFLFIFHFFYVSSPRRKNK